MNIRKIINDNVDASTFVGLDTETSVKLVGGRSNPMQGRVTKKVTGSNVMIFTNKRSNGYENMVFRRLEEEGKNPQDFRLQPRTWGVRQDGSPFIEHNDELYLEVIFLRPGKIEYFLDGQPICSSQIIGLDLAKQEADQGGLDRKVIIRTYSVASIRAIRINKQEYVL